MHSPDAAAADALARRPEQTFFAEPAIDRALGIIMALATEVYVLRDRASALERQLVEHGVLDLDRLNAQPSAADAVATAVDRRAFVDHLLTPVIGVQASKGMTP